MILCKNIIIFNVLSSISPKNYVVQRTVLDNDQYVDNQLDYKCRQQHKLCYDWILLPKIENKMLKRQMQCLCFIQEVQNLYHKQIEKSTMDLEEILSNFQNPYDFIKQQLVRFSNILRQSSTQQLTFNYNYSVIENIYNDILLLKLENYIKNIIHNFDQQVNVLFNKIKYKKKQRKKYEKKTCLILKQIQNFLRNIDIQVSDTKIKLIRIVYDLDSQVSGTIFVMQPSFMKRPEQIQIIKIQNPNIMFGLCHWKQIQLKRVRWFKHKNGVNMVHSRSRQVISSSACLRELMDFKTNFQIIKQFQLDMMMKMRKLRILI